MCVRVCFFFEYISKRPSLSIIWLTAYDARIAPPVHTPPTSSIFSHYIQTTSSLCSLVCGRRLARVGGGGGEEEGDPGVTTSIEHWAGCRTVECKSLSHESNPKGTARTQKTATIFPETATACNQAAGGRHNRIQKERTMMSIEESWIAGLYTGRKKPREKRTGRKIVVTGVLGRLWLWGVREKRRRLASKQVHQGKN